MLKKQVIGSPEAQAWGAASAFFVFFFTGIFASTWLDVPFTYPTETFPLEVRARGNAFGTVGWGLGCGTVSLLVPVWFACTLFLLRLLFPVRTNDSLQRFHSIPSSSTVASISSQFPSSGPSTLKLRGVRSKKWTCSLHLTSLGFGRRRRSLLG